MADRKLDDKKGDSQNESESSEDVPEEQSSENPTGPENQNLPSGGDSSSVKDLSSRMPVPRLSSRIASKQDSPSQSTRGYIFYSSRQLRSRTNCSRSADAVISPRKNTAAFTSRDFMQLDDNFGGKKNLKRRALLEDFPGTDLPSPSVRITRAMSKIKKNDTLSPKQQNIEKDVDSTPTRKIRKTPESSSNKLTTGDKYRLKRGSSAKAGNLHKSPTDPQIQGKSEAAVHPVKASEGGEMEDVSSISSKETRSASKAAGTETEKRTLKALDSSPVNLNPPLPPQIDCSMNVPPSVLEYGTPVEKRQINQNISDSTVRTETPNRESVQDTPTPQLSFEETGAELMSSSTKSSRARTRQRLSNVSITDNTSIPQTENESTECNVPSQQSFSRASDVQNTLTNVENRQLSSGALDYSLPGPSSGNPPREVCRTLSHEVLSRLDRSSRRFRWMTGIQHQNMPRYMQEIVKHPVCLDLRVANRRSPPDVTLGSRNLSAFQQQCDARNRVLQSMPERSQSEEGSASIPAGIGANFQQVNPEFQRVPQSSASSERSAPINRPQTETELQRNHPLLTEMITTRFPGEPSNVQQVNPEFQSSASSDASAQINWPQVETGLEQNNPLLTEMLAARFAGEPSTSRIRPEVQMYRDRNEWWASRFLNSMDTRYNPFLNTLTARKSEGSSSIRKDRSAVLLQLDDNYGREESESEAESTSSNRTSASADNRNTPPYIDVVEGEASTSRYQPTAREEPSSSTDVIGYGNLRERRCGRIERCTQSSTERYPEYASEATVLLQSVLKDILQHNEDGNQWREISLGFQAVSKSFSERATRKLKKDLTLYLAERKVDMPWHPNMPRRMTEETYTLGAYEMLTTVVITALTGTLTIRSDQYFDELITAYRLFRNLYDTFYHYWQNNHLKDIVDEETRNRTRKLKKIIERLLVTAMTAFRTFLMYAGENIDDRRRGAFERHIAEEDKQYFKRK